LLELIERYRAPASTLTDNGGVYTSRFSGARNASRMLAGGPGDPIRTGPPGHPQTQEKIERFHQTPKRWLKATPPAGSTAELQRQLDEFRARYNEQRPHRALEP
jgi:transposase InsO family protein